MLKGVARRVPARCLLLPFCLAIAVGLGQEVIDSVDVGGWNVDALTYNSMAGVVYGRCFYGQNVFAIDCSTDQLVAQIPVEQYPIDVAYSATSNKAYCSFTNYGDSVLVIDGSTHTRIKTIPLYGAYLLKWDSVSNRLYVTCFTDGSDDCVAVIDCQTDSVIATIPIPGEPVHLTINTRHRKLYCQNDYDMTVSVIDMNTNQVIRNVYTGSSYFSECYSEVADKYYCSFSNGAEGITVVDGATDSVIKQIPLPQGYGPTAMVSIESESLVMVAAYSGGADSVYAISTRTDSVRSALRCGASPLALVYSPQSRVVYCANSGWDDLSVIAGDGSRVIGMVAVGDIPQALLAVPCYEKLYVGHGGETNMLYIVRDRVGISESALRGFVWVV
jgi:YVTN family beta-propeller protein